MAEKGLRVLGGAEAAYLEKDLPESQHEFAFKFVGLFGFIDQVRPTAANAIAEAYSAGMRVIVITGDYPGTAQFVAKKIGLRDAENFITGEQLEKMSIEELREKIKTINIFARVVPEQKLMIVNALKANGEIVAMTGDGVNDAPALKSAHIGIAMGERGTDVAREAASLILLNDDFSSIVAAVRLGRRIYDNLKRAMGYVLAVHIPIAGMSILPLVFGYPIVLLPAHIAFLELIIDPACSTVFESEKEDSKIMKRPPRDLHKSMFSPMVILINVLQGFGVLVATFALYVWAIKSGRSELEARSFAFTMLVLSNLMLIVVNLSWRKNVFQILSMRNKTLLFVFLGAVACLLGVLNIPFFSGLFKIVPLHLDDFFTISTAVLLSLVWFDIWKNFKSPEALPSE
jgi:Ca2+-transporting ATPase